MKMNQYPQNVSCVYMIWLIRILLFSFTWESLRWLKKSSKEMLSREGLNMSFWDDSILKLLKVSIICQNSNICHFFRSYLLRWLKVRSNQYLELNFFSNTELSQSLRPEKWAISEFLHVIEILSQVEVQSYQNLMHMPSRETTSFDDFYSHL